MMIRQRTTTFLLAVAILAAVLAACGGAGEHEEGGEESGTQYQLDETYDEVRAGAHLILSYNADANNFSGTVENTTREVLEAVRVEVHLSNGTELGPTTETDMLPSEIISILLPATEEPFETYSAHPEVGGEGGEDEGEEGGEHEG